MTTRSFSDVWSAVMKRVLLLDCAQRALRGCSLR